MIETARLRLPPWKPCHRGPFLALHADLDVMRDQGGPIDRAHGVMKLARYIAAYEARGFCRWPVETRAGEFVGCVGVMPSPAGHPLGPHLEIGWRLARSAWGLGYATEAARASLAEVFRASPTAEILCYTTHDNIRSRAVIGKLGLRRDPSRDFATVGGWQGLVWVATLS